MAQPQEGRRRRIKQDQKPVDTQTGTATDIAAKLRADADDPDEVRKALDDAAGMSRNLWLAFLTFGTYLAISVASVTHTDLFLQTPIKLPLLNVELPLVAFFWVAPLLFLIFHAYLLLNLRLLVDNVLRFNEMLEGATMRSGSHKLRKRNRLAINTETTWPLSSVARMCRYQSFEALF